ncbi:MAG TPA: TetR/AcrR family transcriptional regulator [Flavobacteriales bacterium]|nr:TetR/AcrR family transcriptional regulator [Flavobacteriales bacterium]HRJ34826.1 TetR/AcrR family transcriptional regulator [Flavobacteriales bacterium]HRJ38140.1 TetR/AcrR family transcriptional regulator [Flavobacteriales bacterium]
MTITLQVEVCNKLFLRDPLETELGKRIIKESIVLLEEIGFEKFTFRKLAEHIESGEPSIYRYFENKHKLLVYLFNWYWAWVECRIQFSIHNISNPKAQLSLAIEQLTQSDQEDLTIAHVDESRLHRIVIRESAKVFQTMDVDQENTEGFFGNYKSLCKTLTEIIQLNRPDYPYAASLSTTLIESAHQQQFLSEHLKSLTSVRKSASSLKEWLEHLAFQCLEC